MKVILSGIVATLVLGIVAAFALRAVQEPAYEAYSTSGTRIDDPGYNLVGPRWNGRPEVQRKTS